MDAEAVVAAPDAPSIYDIPKVLHREGLDAYVVRRLGLSFRDVDWEGWDDLLERVHQPQRTVTVALVGKYVDLPDAYLSVSEAIRAAGFGNRARVQLRWVPSDDCVTAAGAAAALAGVDGIVIPGGFGIRGIEGKIGTARYARENGIPLLGLCLGPAVHDHRGGPAPGRPGRRQLAGVRRARPCTRSSPPWPTRRTSSPGGATWAAPCGSARTRRGSPRARIVAEAYGSTEISERHRHRYEVNNAYRDQLTKAGLRISGTSPDGRLVEFVELDRELHPFFVATQAHPELKSRPTRPHPLFAAFVRAAVAYSRGRPASGRPGRRDGAAGRPQRRRRDGDVGVVSAVEHRYEVRSREVRYRGRIFEVVTEEVSMPGGGTAARDLVRHVGAVAVVALDDAGQVVLIRQYRQPVGRRLWELPAGLTDVAGEDPADDGDARAGRGGRPHRRPAGRAGRPAQLAGVHRRDGPGLPRP